ncbi:FAD-binding protein [Leucobacter sp. CSA1]|uniref:FAD-binding protein n=1 Tax=Leucobacter chromiisoli TaxID=2796471 RepID=A0A934Q5Z8_9MICO|nr:D-arabinono-1,4-lactone oxidase [Leucobacter chromiisoli]MBK0418018.1 FAD-binding protein [Leucobacter chromiisoli]
MADRFTNWSGSLRFTPSERREPEGEEEVVRIVREARDRGRTVRPVGSGHSSTPLMTTEDVLVSLKRMVDVRSADPRRMRAAVSPGIELARLGAELADAGLGMENLGDVDYQSLAGAIATGTHGSGVRLGNLSSTLIGGTLVTGTGDTLPFGVDAGEDEHHDLLRAAQVSLGALGVLTSLTLRLEPAYELRRTNWITHIDWVLENFDELVETNRSMDFYWYPRSDLAQIRLLNVPGEEPELTPPGRLKTDETGPSYEIIPSARDLRFDEMEYMLPFDNGLEAFGEARTRIKEKHRARVAWRVLVRTIAPDRGMISTAQGRSTVTVALLQNASLPHEEYFADMEPLLRSFGGRPHWGKKHSLSAGELRELYPEWDEFQRIRRALDPDGVFQNDYLRQLLDEA